MLVSTLARISSKPANVLVGGVVALAGLVALHQVSWKQLTQRWSQLIGMCIGRWLGPGVNVYNATLVVKTAPGVGCRSHVDKEVVHMSLALQYGKGTGIKHSSDGSVPWAFHSSREAALRIAQDMQTKGCLEACGFGGPAIKLVIPGIPFNQEEDTGIHMSIYNRPANAAEIEYSPPDLGASLQLQGMQVKFGTERDIKILNGNEANDMKTGICYYMSISCDSSATRAANYIKSKVGLPEEPTQRFHLSVAGIAPSWMEAHPKSASMQSAGPATLSRLERDFDILRHGEEQVGFVGFNDDGVTGWSSHAKTIASWVTVNAEIRSKISALNKDDLFAANKAELEKTLKDIRSLGFCKPVGPSEEIKSITRPPDLVQAHLVAMKQGQLASTRRLGSQQLCSDCQ